MKLSYEWLITARYLRSKRTTKFVSIITIISIGGVAVGVMALIIVLATMNGFERDLRDKILQLNSHLMITRSTEGGIADYTTVMEQLAEHSHLTNIEPVVRAKAMITHRDLVDGVLVQGVMPDGFFANALQKSVKRGEARFYPEIHEEQTPYPGIMMGTGLADRIGVIVGDVIVLASPRGLTTQRAILTPKMMKFRVMGLFDTGYFEHNNSYVFIPLTESQRFFKLGDTVTAIECRTDQIYHVDTIREQVKKTLGEDYSIQTWIESNKNLFAAMKIEKIAMFLILTLIIIVAGFNIASTLVMVVMEKTKDIGILKSMGATFRSILLIFMFEGFVIGGLGTLLGSMGGYGVCFFIPYLPVPDTLGYLQKLPVEVQLIDFIWIVVFAFLISLLAALYPSWRAANLKPVDAIRHDWL